MNDTPPDVDRAFTAMFARLGPAARLKMTCAMFDDAKALMAAGIRLQRPDITGIDLRREMFDRLYRDDLGDATWARFRAAL